MVVYVTCLYIHTCAAPFLYTYSGWCSLLCIPCPDDRPGRNIEKDIRLCYYQKRRSILVISQSFYVFELKLLDLTVGMMRLKNIRLHLFPEWELVWLSWNIYHCCPMPSSTAGPNSKEWICIQTRGPLWQQWDHRASAEADHWPWGYETWSKALRHFKALHSRAVRCCEKVPKDDETVNVVLFKEEVHSVVDKVGVFQSLWYNSNNRSCVVYTGLNNVKTFMKFSGSRKTPLRTSSKDHIENLLWNSIQTRIMRQVQQRHLKVQLNNCSCPAAQSFSQTSSD